jgi:hypothetical protein
MKSVTYTLLILLLAGIGGGSYFYLTVYRPMALDHARMKIGMPEFDKAKSELKKYKDREAWIRPAMETVKMALQEETASGKAEIVAVDGSLVVNIAETALYTPGSVTFTKESVPTLEKLTSLLRNLKDLKDKDVFIGNATMPSAAQGTARQRVPAKDALDLAADRSVALVKYLERKGVAKESLIAVAYPARQPDRGFKIKDRKTVIILRSPETPVQEAAAAKKPGALTAAQPKPAPAPKPSGTQAPPALPSQPEQPKPIPIMPAKPKTP